MSSPQPPEIKVEEVKEETDADLENYLEREREFIFELIEEGEGRAVIENLAMLASVNHRAIAQKLFDSGYGLSVLNNLDKFSGLNGQEIASRVIEAGAGWAVRDNLDKFPEADRRPIALKIIDSGQSWALDGHLDPSLVLRSVVVLASFVTYC